MYKWRFRLGGLIGMILGIFLFICSVKYVTAEWPQIFVGLLSIFFSAMGFGLLIMPLDSLDKTLSEDDSKPG
jgi:hypothetical protein